MKKLLLLISLLLTVGCAGQPFKEGQLTNHQFNKYSYYFNTSSLHKGFFVTEPKALVTTSKEVLIETVGSWGYYTGKAIDYFYTRNQPNIEFAVMGAFFLCESKQPIEICELERVNDFEANETEKTFWKNWYIEYKDYYQFSPPGILDGGDYWSLRLNIRYSDKPLKLEPDNPEIRFYY